MPLNVSSFFVLLLFNFMKAFASLRILLASKIDKSVFPGLQGGPHMNAVAAIAITLLKAQTDEFKNYAEQVLLNAKALAQTFLEADVSLVTGGTDNHMLVVETSSSFGLDGRQAEEVLDDVNITTNKQIIPDDPNPPLRPSGIRMGTPAATARGMLEEDMQQLGAWILKCLNNSHDKNLLGDIRGEVKKFCERFPVPGI